MRIKEEDVRFAGTRKIKMEPSFGDVLLLGEPEERSPYWEHRRLVYEEMLASGLLDADTVREAEREAQDWYRNPDAFYFHVLVWVAGRA